MLIEKISKSFFNPKTNEIEERPTYKISYKTLMVYEDELEYAFKKIIMHARYKKLLKLV